MMHIFRRSLSRIFSTEHKRYFVLFFLSELVVQLVLKYESLWRNFFRLCMKEISIPLRGSVSPFLGWLIRSLIMTDKVYYNGHLRSDQKTTKERKEDKLAVESSVEFLEMKKVNSGAYF